MSTPEFAYIDNETFLADVLAVADAMKREPWKPDFVVGIGRGGLVPGAYLSHRTNIPMLSVDHSSKVYDFSDELLMKLARQTCDGKHILFIDDINDSGSTIVYLRDSMVKYGCVAEHVKFAVLLNNLSSRTTVDYWSRTINRTTDKRWFVFPWEAVSTHDELVEEANEVPQRLA
ncbi:phosphoribosyltransferase [Sphingomonas sp. ID0503]|uniref:phosphoribosyltransferase n=1 Tax=Sphingomonas sp. ID0503 TaxID=3399691 RepID=UPI003AFB21DE